MDERLQRLSPEARQKAIDSMTLEQKAEFGYLPDYLSIAEICDLMHPVRRQIPEDRTERANWRLKKNIKAAYQDDLINACKAGDLEYCGDIRGWEYYGKNSNPHPLAKNGKGEIFIPDLSKSFCYETRYELGVQKPVKHKCGPTDCTIHKADFKRYLESLEQWPVKNGLLANWWAVEQSNAIIQTDSKLNLITIKTNVFCKPPKRKDSWFDAIEEATLTLLEQLGKLPNEAQVWGQLSTNPPHGYEITPGTDKGEDCLHMPGENPLPRGGFSRRWKRWNTK